jgi:hypothetical protein
MFWDPSENAEKLEKILSNGISTSNSTWPNPDGETDIQDLWSNGTHIFGCGSVPIPENNQFYAVPFIAKWDIIGNYLGSYYNPSFNTEHRIIARSIWSDGDFVYVISDFYNLTTYNLTSYNGMVFAKYDRDSLNPISTKYYYYGLQSFSLYPDTMVSNGTHLFVIGYREYQFTSHTKEEMVICLNLNGDIVWEKYYTPTMGWSFGIDGCIQDNYLYIIGYTSQDYYELTLHKIDLNSQDTIWIRSLGDYSPFSELHTRGYSIALESNYIYTVGSYSNNEGLLVVWNLNGEPLCHKLFGTNGMESDPLCRGISVYNKSIYLSYYRYEPDPATEGKSALVFPELCQIKLIITESSSGNPNQSENSQLLYLNWTVQASEPCPGSDHRSVLATDSGVYWFYCTSLNEAKLLKFDHNGFLQFNTTVSDLTFSSLSFDLWSNGINLYGCGTTLDNTLENNDAFLVKWDMDGNVIQTRIFGNNTIYENAKSIWGDTSYIYVVSELVSTSDVYGLMLSKFSASDLSSIWNQTIFESKGLNHYVPEKILSDGTNLFTIGYNTSNDWSSLQQMIYSWDMNGNLIWTQYYGIQYNVVCYDAVICNNALYLVGSIYGESDQLHLHKLNKETGLSIWNVTYANPSNANFNSYGYGIATNTTHLFTVGSYETYAEIVVWSADGQKIFNLTYGNSSNGWEPYGVSITMNQNRIYTSYFEYIEFAREVYRCHPVLVQIINNQTVASPALILPSPPIFITTSQNITNNSLLIRWNTVLGAEKYQLFLNASLLQNTTETFYNWTVNSNGQYVFSLRSINGSGSSIFSDQLVINVKLEEIPNDIPFFTPIVVFGACVGSVVGIGFSQVPQARQVLTQEFWKKRRYLSKKDAPINNSSSEIIQNNMQNSTIAVGSNLNFNDLIGSLKAMWDSIPNDLRDLLVKGMDKYLKFKDEAELALMNTFYNLSQGFLNVCHLYRDGNFTESLAKLKEIEQKSHEIKFTDLSDEAKLMQTDSMKKISPGGSQ